MRTTFGSTSAEPPCTECRWYTSTQYNKHERASNTSIYYQCVIYAFAQCEKHNMIFIS